MQLFAADYPFDLPQDHVDFLKKYASLLAYWDGLFPNRKRGIFRLVHKPRFAPGVADLVAAVISTFVRDEPPAMLSLASQLRSYATDLMVEQGFTPKTRTDVKRVSLSSSPGAIHRVLLAGCQNEVELLSRVQCCAELLASTEGPTEVVLSGRNPGGRGAYQILDEATIMQSWLEEMKSSNPGLRDRVTWTRLEQQSTRSEENVANFFRQVTADRASEMGAVFIVSSDYHLPRLVRTATQHIRSHSLKATCLVAAGAPYPTSGNSRAQLAFLKQALFEVCSHFQGFMPSPEAVRDRGRDLLREFLHSRNEIRPASLTCRRKIRFRAQDSVAQVSFRHRFTGSGSMDVTLHSPGTLEGPKGDVEWTEWTVHLPGAGLRRNDVYELEYTLEAKDPFRTMRPFVSIAPNSAWAPNSRAILEIRFLDFDSPPSPRRIEEHLNRPVGSSAHLAADSDGTYRWEITNPNPEIRYLVHW